MSKTRKKKRKKTNILLGFVCILLAVLLGFILVTNYKTEQEESKHLSEIAGAQQNGIEDYEAVKKHADELEKTASEDTEDTDDSKSKNDKEKSAETEADTDNKENTDQAEDTTKETAAASGIVCWGDDLINGEESATYSYIRILSEKERTLTELSMIETELTNVLGHDISFEVENRVQEKIDNDAMLNGYKLIIGALCVLLAFIGIANVFSNTLGFIRQRKREFARYMSIGMTPEGMRKMFWIEALVIAGRPVLITLPITVVFVWLMITASYLNPMEFLAVAPIVPILLFIAALFGFVALAYYLGGKKILKCDLVEALRTDYMG